MDGNFNLPPFQGGFPSDKVEDKPSKEGSSSGSEKVNSLVENRLPSPKKEETGKPVLKLERGGSSLRLLNSISSHLPRLGSPKNHPPSEKLVMPSKNHLGAIVTTAVPSLQTQAFHQLKLRKLMVPHCEDIKKIDVHFKSPEQPILEALTFEDPVVWQKEKTLTTGDVDPSFGELRKMVQEGKFALSKLGAAFINNYPINVSISQINCDAFHAEVHPDYQFSMIADGCGLGPLAREAAQRAVAGATKHLNLMLTKLGGTIKNGEDIGCILIQAIAMAHEAILTGKNETNETGTTTLQICFSFSSPNGKKYLMVAGVGDCKIVLVTGDSERGYRVHAIEGSHRLTSDQRDPGGRVGPYVGKTNSDPDLRNLSINCVVLPSEVSILLSMTDGVYDNFNPSLLGKEPHELDPSIATTKKWGDLPLDLRTRLEIAFQNKLMGSLIQEATNKIKEMNLSKICEALTTYCAHVTSPVREYMNAHPNQKEPADKAINKGKMDHCSVIAYRI